MFIEAFKRTFSLVIPTALILFVVQFYKNGRMSVTEIGVFLIASLFIGMSFEALNILWGRRFGAGKGSTLAKAALWLAVAICLYLFFRHMDRG
jgi:hypothetical protein